MANVDAFTFQDACEHMWLTFNPNTKPPTGRELRVAKLAAITALRSIVNAHMWNYYKRRLSITTEASYSTGTVVYDHSGGTYERMMTLTGGTWPANAAKGSVRIAGVHYRVDERKSDTVITLSAATNPGADVASTSYEWYRDTYQLPLDFGKMRCLIDCTSSGSTLDLDYVPPEDLLQVQRFFYGATTNRPEYYTIAGDSDHPGSQCIVFGGPPNTAVAYEGVYDASPASIKTYLYSTGTVTVSAGTVAVAGGGTAWTSDMVGKVIRFTSSTTLMPTTAWGTIDGTDNPFIAERRIVAVASGTALTIDEAVSSSVTLTAAKYAISEPIDVAPQAMLQAFLRECEAEYCRLTKREDAAEREVLAARALAIAQFADVRDMVPKSAASNDQVVSRIGDVYPQGD
jgi:hypothetical protein